MNHAPSITQKSDFIPVRNLKRDGRVEGREPRVALVHDQLYTVGGAEKVLQSLCEIFPEADVFALFSTLSDAETQEIMGSRVPTTTFLQSFPAVKKLRKIYFAIMPLAIEQLDLKDYDIIVSSSYMVAKGVIPSPDQSHIAYVHSPMRYAWDHQADYLKQMTGTLGLRKLFARLLLHYMRNWDVNSANRADVLVANSKFVARRMTKAYRRPCDVIYPPVELASFPPNYESRPTNKFVTLSRIVEGKRVDLLVEAFRKLPDLELEIIGDGALLNKIASTAPDNVTFLGRLPTPEVAERIQKASGFIYAAEEDFGIAAVEAQACGTPVVAFARGGTCETVIPLDKDSDNEATGILFPEQTADAIAQAVIQLKHHRHRFKAEACRANAERFERKVFMQSIITLVENTIDAGSMSVHSPNRPGAQESAHGKLSYSSGQRRPL